jgi:hypothetical protein
MSSYKRQASFNQLTVAPPKTLEEAQSAIDKLVRHINSMPEKLHKEFTAIERTISKTGNTIVVVASSGGGSSSGGSIVGLKCGRIAVTPAGTTVTFSSPMADLSWILLSSCYKDVGAQRMFIGFNTPKSFITVNGFKVIPDEPAWFEYAAIPFT